MFNWSEESKEEYFKKAEQQIKDSGYEGYLSIDKSKFSVVKDETVKVYTKPFARRKNTRKWQSAIGKIENFKQQKTTRIVAGINGRMVLLQGYFEYKVQQ